jgi:glycosyltransferase involved in cell wall biosynthesis
VLYRLATALVMPTLFESVSIPIYEAFQAGLPVCASAVVALPEPIGDAGLLFDPLSVNSMADSMRTLLRDPVLRRELASRGKKRLALMTHDLYGAQLQGLAEELLQKNNRSASRRWKCL